MTDTNGTKGLPLMPTLTTKITHVNATISMIEVTHGDTMVATQYVYRRDAERLAKALTARANDLVRQPNLAEAVLGMFRSLAPKAAA